MMTSVTAVEADLWNSDGYFVRRGLVSPDDCVELNSRLSRMIAKIGREHACQRRETDFWQQLARSANSVEVFWQPNTREFVERQVMRVGHALHRDPRFAELALRSPVARALASLVPKPASMIQSAIIYKQPMSTLVQFGLHRDTAYLPIEPASSLALAFVALDDCNAENGALQVVAGSHRRGPGVRLRLGASGFEHASGSDPQFASSDCTLLAMARGDVAFVRGATYHASEPNRSRSPRRALILHAIGGDARLHPECWVRVPPEGFSPIACAFQC